MKYRMILLDLDGTLLNDEKKIHPDDVRMLTALKRKGVHIAIATGRRYSFTKPVLADMALDSVVFANNGTTTWDMKTDQCLNIVSISKDEFAQIHKMGKQMGLYPILHVNLFDQGVDLAIEKSIDFKGYCGYVGKHTDKLLQTKDLHEIVQDDTVMIMCYPGMPDQVHTLQKQIDRRFAKTIHTHITMSLKRIGPMLEVTHAEGTKWHSAIRWAQEKGIRPEEIVAIGDDNNDREMLMHAGVGIAMQNAIDTTKEIADIILDADNNQAGVAKGLSLVFDSIGDASS